MSEISYDPELGIQVINDTEVSNDMVFQALESTDPEVAAMVRWSNSTKLTTRHGGLLNRDRYVTPESTWDQMRVAYHAAETDDVVSGVLDMTEALAFGRVSIDCDDPDETNIWSQIAQDLDLETRLREMWREEYTVSQFYVATWWERKDYAVRGKSQTGIRRKKKFNNLLVPSGMTMLDPLKIVPVGNLMFNKDQLAYCADNSDEYDLIRAVIDGASEDPLIKQLMLRSYTPDETERRMLSDDGINTTRLFLMNTENVFRHTATRSQYQRFSPVRMKSVFELLDLKSQLRAMDRALLLGGTNFIVLIKKGDKDRPAKPAELQALNQNVRVLSRTPVIVGDDRLNIEIVTPKTDNTLKPDRYNGLDARITARLYQIFMSGNFCMTPDHEVLTRKRGWVPIAEVEIGEEVASWDVAPGDNTKGVTKWSRVANTPSFHYSGKMLDIRTGPSMCVTPNHMMRWRGNANESAWRWGRADELKGTQRLPAPNTRLPGTSSCFSADEMELYGWWIAEGSGRVGRMTRFTQVKEDGRQQLFELLDRMGVEYKVYGKEIRTRWEPALEVGDRSLVKFIPRELQNEEHIEHLLIGLVRGDGSWRREGWSYSTSSPQLAKDVQELGTRLGYRTRIRPQKTTHADNYVVSGYPLPEWSLYLRFETSDAGPQNAEWIDYEGMVHCLTVPETGTFVVRRNGQVHVTGNSAGTKGDDSIKLAKMVARGLESKRTQIKNTVESRLLRRIYLSNDALTEEPRLRFHPKRIALDFDPTYATYLLDLHDRGALATESVLEEIDYDIDVEARRRSVEDELYDHILTPRAAPGMNFGPNDGSSDGRRLGGLKNGGGAAPGTGQGQEPKDPSNLSDDR